MMRRHLLNSVYSMLEYALQPALMLVAAPVLLHRLGLTLYGVWLIASAAVGAASALSAGFGDAALQQVAVLRGRAQQESIRGVVGTMITLNLSLGSGLAAALWVAVPFAVHRMTHDAVTLYPACVWAMRIGALIIVVKSVESVFLGTLRAFERYAAAGRIGIATRILLTSTWIVLALRGYGIVALMIATAIVSTTSVLAAAVVLRASLHGQLPTIAFDLPTMKTLLSFGSYSWLQALAGVVFSQADRLLLGTTLGAPAVACYGVCVQMAQPIHGLCAAGLHFLFPHLARRTAESGSLDRRLLGRLFAVNFITAALLTSSLLLVGPRMLGLWMGTEFAAQADALLPWLAIAFGLLALNVTAHYALMALARVRLVTTVNVAGGLLMLFAMTRLVPTHGVAGAALARLWYAPVTWLLYLPLLAALRRPQHTALALERP